MTIKSRNITQTTQVIPSSAVATILIRALQLIAIVFMVASTFGNYVQFVGGWPEEVGARLPLDAAAILYAVVYQIGCSIAQWGCKAQRWWIAYGAALIVSAIPSFFTYSAWAGIWLAALIGPAFAAIAIGLIVVFIDMIPEWILVR